MQENKHQHQKIKMKNIIIKNIIIIKKKTHKTQEKNTTIYSTLKVCFVNCHVYVSVVTLVFRTIQVPLGFYIHRLCLPKLKGSFVIFSMSMLLRPRVRWAINFLSKRDITVSWQRDVSAAGKKNEYLPKKVSKCGCASNNLKNRRW